MSRLDRVVGSDEARTRRERAPLWQRAVWRALKRLVYRYPRAAVSAAGAGLGYAARQGTREAAEALGEKIEALRARLSPRLDVLPRDRPSGQAAGEHEVPRDALMSAASAVTEVLGKAAKSALGGVDGDDGEDGEDVADRAPRRLKSETRTH